MNMVKCVEVGVLRRTGIDCTNGGVSYRHDAILVPCEGGYIDVDMDNPPENLCKVVRGRFCGEVYVHLKPVCLGDKWSMAGGNFAYTSDSRFQEIICNGGYPVAIHDRVE